MQNELKLTFRNIPHSAALEALIRTKAAKLDRFHPRLTSCHVVVAAQGAHMRHRGLFAATLNIAIPGGEVVVTRENNDDAYAMLRDAFSAAERELEKAAGQRSSRAAPHHVVRPELSALTAESQHE